MALWGTADSVFSVGTVSVTYATKVVTGSGTSFSAAAVGDVITIGVGGTFGSAIISGITSQTQLSIGSTQFLSGAAISGVAYTMSQRPKYVLHDPNFATITGSGNSSSINRIYGIDPTEAGIARTTKYAVAHPGWVGIHTYVDMHGNLRVKSETLVAFSGISSGTPSYTAYGDANDDNVNPGIGATVFTP